MKKYEKNRVHSLVFSLVSKQKIKFSDSLKLKYPNKYTKTDENNAYR